MDDISMAKILEVRYNCANSCRVIPSNQWIGNLTCSAVDKDHRRS